MASTMVRNLSLIPIMMVVYNRGEKFFDIGLIDPTPASLNVPLKNTAPTISWNTLSTTP